MFNYNTLIPYKVIEHRGIQYTVCRKYDHISRYKGLRQVIHNPADSDRFITLENSNPFSSNVKVTYYEVPYTEENRLDIIANKFLGSPNYAWIIAYLNDIEDGFTVREGQNIMIPESISSLFQSGEVLAPINPITLNLGQE